MQSPYVTRSSMSAAWLLLLVAAVGSLSPSMSPLTLTAIAIIGLAPLVILNLLARNRQPTMTEAIRAVCARRSE